MGNGEEGERTKKLHHKLSVARTALVTRLRFW